MTDSPEWWLIFVILAIWEGETEELQVPGQHGLCYKTTPLNTQRAWEAAQWQSRKAPSQHHKVSHGRQCQSMKNLAACGTSPGREG